MAATNKVILAGVLSGFVMAPFIFFWPRPKTVVPQPARRQSCPTTIAQEQVSPADMIITGRVFAVIPFGHQAEVLIVPEQLYRGTIPSQGVNIVTARRPARGRIQPTPAGSIAFQSNQGSYLLFLHRRPDGRYASRPCDGTRLLGAGLTSQELRLLGPGEAVDPPQF